jgi:quercetin dioxygenase-like cupin family protein
LSFHRFDEVETRKITAHLSSAEGPVIEGNYIYFGLNQKKAGTGSELHYHPNELLIFVVRGRLNAVVGRDHQIVDTGTFIIVPPNVRHAMRATEDGDCAYLYIKDRTWTVVGVGADEPLPERPLTMEESEELLRRGTDAKSKVKPVGASQAIVDNVPKCIYPITENLRGAYRYGNRIEWIEGERMAFGYLEISTAFSLQGGRADEQFYYVCDGALDCTVDGETKRMRDGDIVHVPRGASFGLAAENGGKARLAGVRALQYLIDRLDSGQVPS